MIEISESEAKPGESCDVPKCRPPTMERRPYFFDTLNIHCDSSVKTRFVDFANETFGGRQYVALTQLMDWWNESRHISNLIANQQAMAEEIDELKKKLSVIEDTAMNNGRKEEEKKTITTMGGHELEV